MKTNVVTVPEAAKRKGVTPQAIRYAIRTGLLSATRQGRLWLVHLDDSFGRYSPGKQAGVPKPRRKAA